MAHISFDLQAEQLRKTVQDRPCSLGPDLSLSPRANMEPHMSCSAVVETPSISRIIVLYIIPYMTPFKELRSQLIEV